ncbi:MULTISPECIES: dethiobiotin synthase [spotted fever group]|uniref:ATP-dependent dethiobiotin synthetase BioD n=1 Tax=Rickettsia tamurae subsp. buchneri TaxID=1462938 RepID=A0A8E0WK95_9RICK|nr:MULTISPECIES: dethiobiotin synthase [spotted fever group]EER20796.1 dethiobiotin synthase [Rickettsia endosymbiont of Ixodes scapularis]EER20823.1 dethiobiotin synthase [Rickettsia endosymbiont of Ixodes scapularis]KDO02147.1 ATP-dependent dethiobiotin synthetase BioD [Rickettsia tamurae subsp. buchneri]KDO02190.1 ATP-dependent dethiobiotin synthetase BioD [Rickettsia tamurae subsp. buchneri]
MQVFITGTDTNIGKTFISSWLCLHTGYEYFKPIQTGCYEGTDSNTISRFTDSKIHKETYLYQEPLSPHLAAMFENKEIDISKIQLPKTKNLIIEGAGGLLVPINRNYLMIDLIKLLSIPVILVASSELGTINHTLLSLEALKSRNIEILGCVVSGKLNQYNCDAIEFYGATKILIQFPYLPEINKDVLRKIPLTQNLQQILKI